MAGGARGESARGVVVLRAHVLPGGERPEALDVLSRTVGRGFGRGKLGGGARDLRRTRAVLGFLERRTCGRGLRLALRNVG